MRFTSTFTILLAAGGALASVPHPRPGNETKQRVAYFQDNDPAGVNIVALQVSNEDGTLSSPVRTPTGGKGLAGLIAISVDSVTVKDNYLFTTNAGDNTVSMLVIDPKDPMHPKVIGSPAPTLGDTPVSVAYSEVLKIACALNSGQVTGAACFSVDPAKGLTPLGGLRSVPHPEVDPNNPAKPAPGPLTVAAQILFNPSSTALFFTTGAVNSKAGHIYAYPVTRDRSEISMQAIDSSFPQLPFLFSLNFLSNSDSRLITTNPVANAAGAAFLSVSADFHVSYTQTITLPRQQAACWVAYSPRFDNLYIADAAQPNFTYISPKTGAVEGVVQFAAPAMTGGQDNVVFRDHLYFLTDDQKSPRIDVYDLGGQGKPSLVQSFDIFKEVGKLVAWQGMANWPKRS